MALRVEGALLFWRYVHTPEQPGKGKDRGGGLRFQLSRSGVSWDKATVLSEPEGFLVLLHFKKAVAVSGSADAGDLLLRSIFHNRE